MKADAEQYNYKMYRWRSTCTTYMVYMKADAEQYNYKMYRWRSTYLAAANNYKQYMANNYKQYTAYSTELNGARGVRATSCSQLAVYTKAPYFISPGSCTLTSSTSKTRVPPSTRRGGTNFSRPPPRQAVLERHGGLEC